MTWNPKSEIRSTAQLNYSYNMMGPAKKSDELLVYYILMMMFIHNTYIWMYDITISAGRKVCLFPFDLCSPSQSKKLAQSWRSRLSPPPHFFRPRCVPQSLYKVERDSYRQSVSRCHFCWCCSNSFIHFSKTLVASKLSICLYLQVFKPYWLLLLHNKMMQTYICVHDEHFLLFGHGVHGNQIRTLFCGRNIQYSCPVGWYVQTTKSVKSVNYSSYG